MTSVSGIAGFQDRPAPATSNRLTGAVAASLALAALSLCLSLVLTLLTANVVFALPLPA